MFLILPSSPFKLFPRCLCSRLNARRGSTLGKGEMLEVRARIFTTTVTTEKWLKRDIVAATYDLVNGLLISLFRSVNFIRTRQLPERLKPRKISFLVRVLA